MTADAGDLTSTAGDAGRQTAVAWSLEDSTALASAVAALERTSFATRLSDLVGRQIGLAGDLIPASIAKTANLAAAKALSYAMRAARTTLGESRRMSSPRLHVAAVAASGAIGGAFGLATLPIELPVSTTLILRSIADIARQEGEDLGRPETELACVEVFGLGAGRDRVPLGDSSYFATRAVLAQSITEAARYILKRGLVEETAPALLRVMSQIASRFGLVVTQKVLAQGLPLIGAVTGATINAAFMDHYQHLARGHFIVRRLERRYGAAAVRDAYERIRQGGLDPAAGSGVPTGPASSAGPSLIEVAQGTRNGIAPNL